jgi:type I pantothenate kinase
VTSEQATGRSNPIEKVLEEKSPYLCFEPEDWGRLRADAPLTLTEADLDQLRGINEHVSMDEVREIYLPLSRLLNLYVGATQGLYNATAEFLGNREEKVPYIIAIAGSVAVGKSTTARILQALLSRWKNHLKVDLVTTDGFLWPNEVLEARGLMARKGFPESFDVSRLAEFVTSVKSGERGVTYPIYSHLAYDIVPDQFGVVDRPDIMILEGLNVLQPPPPGGLRPSRRHLADLFDFSIYVDAETEVIERWYVERFLTFRDTAFKRQGAYFRRFADLSEREAIETARDIWKRINEANLLENILSTRERATLILGKAPDHTVSSVRLRKL